MANLILGSQLAAGTVKLANLNADVIARFTAIEANITSIEGIMSTDQERLDAIAAVTDAFQAADSNLSGTITALGSGIRTGAGLGENGAYVQASAANYIAGATSIHNATVLLDTALKTVADNLATETSARESAVSGLQVQIDAITNGAATQTNIYGANFLIEAATVVDAATGKIGVTHDIATGVVPVVFQNGQQVDLADVSRVDGQPKQLALANIAPDDITASKFAVQYFFR